MKPMGRPDRSPHRTSYYICRARPSMDASRLSSIPSGAVCVRWHSARRGQAASPGAGGERPAASPGVDRNAGLSEAEISEGIQKVNDTNYNLSRAMLNKVLDNAGKLIGIAAVTPKMEGGESTGMEIQGVHPDTLLTKLGIQNGDILESVNGQSLTTPDAALGAYSTLRTADQFSLSVRRAGRAMTINYRLQ